MPAAALASIVPGANQVLSLRNAVRQGTVDATVALIGRFTAFAVLVVAAAAGLAATVMGSPVAFSIIKWAGVVYLTWVGLTTLWGAIRRRDGAEAETHSAAQDKQQRERWSLIRGEFSVAITNPKAFLLFAAFIPQFVTVEASGGQLAVLGFAYIGIEAVSALGYTLVGGRIGALGLSRRAQRRLDAITSVSFLVIAVFLALGR